MKRWSLIFESPGEVSLQDEDIREPGPGYLLIENLCSAISPGTEMLIYRGQFPSELSVDQEISSLSGQFQYPLKYGYSSVGQIIQVGSNIPTSLEGDLVFSFHPHESHFLATLEELVSVPADIPVEDAVFLPNMETAVNLVMDGKPVIGEKVVVFGQGIVGMLTTALLARFPISQLITLDCFPLRRQVSESLGAHSSFDPFEPDILATLRRNLINGADLVFELSGSPRALDQAIAVTGYGGRVVIGSWYGKKRADLNLGGEFHRNRIHLVSSQVSTIAPELTGRWTKNRRFEVVWDMIRHLKPSRFITHRFPITEADSAYKLIDQSPGEILQPVFSYKTSLGARSIVEK